MNMHGLLFDVGYELIIETGMIDYKIVELGKRLQRTRGGLMELIITKWEDEQVFIYSFFDSGFSVRRWVKKEE